VHDLVQRAPDLEGANRLNRLDLEVDLAAGFIGEGARELERRRRQIRPQVTGGALDVLR